MQIRNQLNALGKMKSSWQKQFVCLTVELTQLLDGTLQLEIATLDCKFRHADKGIDGYKICKRKTCQFKNSGSDCRLEEDVMSK